MNSKFDRSLDKILTNIHISTGLNHKNNLTNIIKIVKEHNQNAKQRRKR